ncbi:MAG: hypothetical protein LKE86_02850 [Eubacterium sp.]|jgi:metallophosphoesterase superfamily enzyme|nr:hypothetical protein [Eubacterium sp.]MCH4046366.1 hypothetical protein [Eubacterium sp.]MCH4079461.1 hypothetical protein [Eubacterium sp.]MCH4110989.1 hypothetical protein [Eubacterium sp.]MCI1405703.1 hypothetical protein [Eubacterium sp.]
MRDTAHCIPWAFSPAKSARYLYQIISDAPGIIIVGNHHQKADSPTEILKGRRIARKEEISDAPWIIIVGNHHTEKHAG